MNKIVCFGEIMGRLNPEGYLRIKQARKYELSFAGGEVNAAVTLANFGCAVSFVSKIPDNDLSEALLRDLRGYKLDVSDMVFGGERLGMYYVEKGSSQRPTKVIYDRKYSSISMASRRDFDWDSIFKGATWFHFTGITPALSDNAADITRDALLCARARGITISCDTNYRKNLWTQEKAGSVMRDLMQHVDICITNKSDAKNLLGISDKGSHKESARHLMEAYTNLKSVAYTMRESSSASLNDWAALLYDGKDHFESKKYRFQVVDRLGGGDCFAGSLIYAINSGYSGQDTIEFAAAASCLKHTTEYDFSQATAEEVHNLMKGDATGRVQR